MRKKQVWGRYGSCDGGGDVVIKLTLFLEVVIPSSFLPSYCCLVVPRLDSSLTHRKAHTALTPQFLFSTWNFITIANWTTFIVPCFHPAEICFFFLSLLRRPVWGMLFSASLPQSCTRILSPKDFHNITQSWEMFYQLQSAGQQDDAF